MEADFDFSIVNFPFIYCNIPVASVYGVYISQLIPYHKDWVSCRGSLDKGSVLTKKLLSDWVEVVTSKVLRSPPWISSPLRNIRVIIYYRHVPIIVITIRSFTHSYIITGFVMMGATSWTGTVYPPRAH